jgi:hypothetical protein
MSRVLESQSISSQLLLTFASYTPHDGGVTHKVFALLERSS